MARILAYTSPAQGHLFPTIAILDQLAARGHEVSVRALSAHVPMLQARGVNAASIAERLERIEQDDWQAGNQRAALVRVVRCLSERAHLDGPDLQQAIAQVDPDVVLVDINSWGALAAAEAWGGPWAAIAPFPLALGSVDVPPFGPGLAPARGPLGRGRDRLLRPAVLGTVERTMRPGLNGVRTRFGLTPLDRVDDMFGRPPLVLSLTAEPFEYQRRDWPENVVMVGPCDWEPASALPAWWDQISGPIVLVSTSSEFQNDGRLVRAALTGLANEPFTVIATAPAGDQAGYDLPANAHVAGFVPHGPLLERAVCAITHGGMGATQKALARGVPVCAVPFGRDQFEVARRVEVSGAGTRLAARRLRPDRVRDSVRAAITHTAGAARVAAGFAAAGGAKAAAGAIESRLLAIEPDR